MSRVVLAALLLSGCGNRLTVKPPPEPLRTEQTDAWIATVHARAQAGDWLVVRGYKGVDDLVVAATNIPLSHAGVYDPATDQVIEAVGEGVRAVPLRAFAHISHRLLIIRPKWWTPVRGHTAVHTAIGLIGSKYDFMGTVGMGKKTRYYCSELAVQIYEPWHGDAEHLPKVIEPGQMFLWGKIIHDTGPRD